MWQGYQRREKGELWKIAWINAEQYNSSGLLDKGKRVKPEDFIKEGTNGKQQTKDGVVEKKDDMTTYDPVKPIKHMLKKADPAVWGENPPWDVED